MADITSVLKKNGENVYPYLIYKPKDFSTRNNWPVIFQFHGSGDGGDGSEQSMFTSLMKQTTWLKMANEGKEFDCIIIAPQAGKDSKGKYDFSTEMVCGFKLDGTQSSGAPYAYNNLISHALRIYADKIDINRIHVNGYSAGGRIAMQVLSAIPQTIASCLAACPAIEVSYPSDRVLDKPIRAFQNSLDETVSSINITNVSMRLKEINNIKENILLNINKSESHDAWTAMYKDMANYNWQIAQYLPPPIIPKPEPVYDFVAVTGKESLIDVQVGGSAKFYTAEGSIILIQSPEIN